MEANFALDANAGSASPKGWQAAAKRGLIANNPFSRSKIKEPLSEWFFYFCVDMGRMFDPLGSRVRLNSFGTLKKISLFRPSPLYNYKFYFYIWVTLAGIAQLVEHDLAKVGVEGPSPFSRSKTKSLATS